MALPLNSYCITKTIYLLAETVSVSLMLSESTGHQTAKKANEQVQTELWFLDGCAFVPLASHFSTSW